MFAKQFNRKTVKVRQNAVAIEEELSHISE
jgi:hypothetical protein